MRPEDKKQYKNTEAYESVANLLTSLAESTDDINALLRSVAEYYDADRGYVFEITADGKAVDNTYEWCREGVTAEINNLQNVPIESVEVWIREFKKNGAFYISSLDTDVEKSSLTYEVLEPQGIDSLITAPLYKGKEISGFVGIDNPHKNTNDLLILKTAASIIYSDIRRTIAEKKEKEVAESLQNRFFAGTFLNTFESAYYINLEENTFVILRQKEFLHEGYSYQTNWVDVITKYVNEGIVQEDREKFAAVCDIGLFREQIEKEPEYHVVFRDTSIGYERYCCLHVLRGEDLKHAAVAFMDVDAETRAEEANAVISSMAEDFDYIACVNTATNEVSVFRATEKFLHVLACIDQTLPTNKQLDAFFNLVIHLEDMKHFRENANEVRVRAELEKNDIYKFECRTVHPETGRQEYYRFKFARVPSNSDLIIVGMLNIDTQVRREMEAATLKERLETKTMIDSLAESYLSLYQVNLNTGWFRILKSAETVPEEYYVGELPFEETVTRWIKEEVYPDDRANALEAVSIENIRQRFEKGSSFSVSIRHNRYGNHYREMRFVRSGDYEETGNFFVSFIENHEYIMAQKRAEEQAALVDLLSDEYVGVYTLNLDTCQSNILKQGDQMDEWMKQELGQFSLHEAMENFIREKVHPEDRELLLPLLDYDRLRQLLAHQKRYRVTFRRLFADGYKYMDYIAGKEEDIDETPCRVAIGFQIVDDRVRAVKDAEKQKELLEVTSILSTMAEDFDYVAAVDQKEKTVTTYWTSDKYNEVEEKIDKALPSNKRFDKFINRIVHPDDLKMFRERSDYNVSIDALNKHQNYKFEFRTFYQGKEEYYRIKFAYKPDNHDIVILGLLNIDEQVRREQNEAVLHERAERDAEFREQMSRVMGLSDELQAIYDVDVETGGYEYFTYSDDYVDSVLENMTTGKDFFADAAHNTDIIIYPDDREIIRNCFSNREYFRKMFAEQGGFVLEYRQIINGEPVWYRSKMIKKAGDSSRCLIGVFNIDEQVKAEKEHQKQLEEQMARIMGLSDNFQAIYDVDFETGSYDLYTYENEFTDSVLVNMSKGESFYVDAVKDADLVVHPDDRDLTRSSFSDKEYIRKRLDKDGDFSVDYRILTDKGPVWYRAKVAKKVGDDTHFLLGVFFVDERVRKEEEYKRSIEQELNVIRGLASDLVSLYTVNLEEGTYRTYSISKEAEDIRPIVENSGTLSLSFHKFAEGFIHEEDKDKFLWFADTEHIRQALENTRSHKIMMRRNYGGDWRWIELNMIKVEPVSESAKNVILAFTNRDRQVKEEFETRKQLRDALSMAETANKAKTDFLFSMSHDIRTPMNAITGYTNMAIKHIEEKDKVLDYLNKTQKAGSMLLSLINSVLEVSRIEAGHATIDEQPGDVYLSFANISTTMQELAATKDISLSFEFLNIKDRYVYADFSRCIRVFTNIISNAIKYTPSGGCVEVTCEQAGVAKDDIATYRYTVTDNGIGMSEEFQKHVFDQFSRENTSTVSGIQGTGLGMSVVKSFVELLGGTVTVKSKKGQGTTFTVLLPFKLQKEMLHTDPVSGEVLSDDADNAKNTDSISFAGRKVLLVEDNEMNREIATEILEEAGLIVDTAEDGSIAYDIMIMAKPGDYDAILMDIQMPVMDGYTATKKIRELDNGMEIIPIIALSANAFAEDRKKSIEAGMNDHISKPINISHLKETLAKYM